jgi:hypothetical protein
MIGSKEEAEIEKEQRNAIATDHKTKAEQIMASTRMLTNNCSEFCRRYLLVHFSHKYLKYKHI